MTKLRDLVVCMDKKTAVEISVDPLWPIWSGVLGEITLDIISKYLDRDVVYIGADENFVVVHIN